MHHIAGGGTSVHQRLEIRDKSIENRESDNDAHAHGKYGNVFLSDEEISELQTELSASVLQDYVERLSEYMESTGREYKSHAATIGAGQVRTGKGRHRQQGTGTTP